MFSKAFWIIVNVVVIGLGAGGSQSLETPGQFHDIIASTAPPPPLLPPPNLGCPSTDAGNQVVGGNWTSIEENPWQVSLQIIGGFHICGGSIIDKKWILTSARCAR